ncbi:MAG TPA: phenylacetate--CoA ligase [Termitinemataceae bacterium]|uniref:phenylacetate--CoA ligase family protein n=1 Tax=Treponema sp. J25 TaxID=2094121 RepID=UPI00104ED9A7|nr:phenylacetate--CoA ligase [Treponema sp. J25]TCW60866.1 phenylacetate--CoA ligase [Treponema sp. J25]HOJ99676.1 phenylacetate--CoA ligase [Termitinemataceae bacterium]HOM23811.1 phenylacetate--CoA ligase [Termitinemataceae bacterium]HPQ00888.1 phenylacetate--CoA ligase [Termitinemataceae bacterium]
MNYQYWDKEIETLPREELENLQLTRLRKVIDRARTTPFYKKILDEAGIKGGADIRTLADLRHVPFTTKQDLRDAFPYGMLAVPLEEVVRLHASSGTTGTPTTIYFTRKDIEVWAHYMARCIYGTGCTRQDVFQNMITYGLFTGGLGFHYGAEEVGMLVIPAGPGNTSRQFKMMKDFKTTVVHATPSFLLHLQSKMQEEGLRSEDLFLRKAFAGAEPYSEDTRRRIEAMLHVDVYNSYGLSEMNGPGVAFECQHKDGMHLWEDGYIAEIVDPDTLKPVPDGEQGELVLTILCREAMPILRYRTRDLTAFYTEPCPCGRTHRRIRRITGRTDDMLIINGVNVFPSQIEEVLMAIPEVGNNYVIVVEKEGALDRLTVQTEVGPQIFMDDARPLNALKERIQHLLQNTIFIKPRVELHEPGTLPVSEGKAKRVIDKRPKDV